MTHCYKLYGYNIVLDTASGSVHSVDDIAYDAIRAYERGGADEAVRLIADKHADVPDEELRELIADIESLRKHGKLFTPDDFGSAVKAERDAPVKALCLNVSHKCNMTCGYCFAGKGEYRGEEKLMPLETGLRSIDFLIEKSGSRKNLYIDFFGGEPLLNWDVVKRVVGYAREKERKSGKRFHFTLTTNGLLIDDDDVIGFTREEMDNVVLSLDGRPEVNDAFRRRPDGSGTYDAIVPKFRRLVDSRDGKGYYIRGTFTRNNLDFCKDILHCAELGFTELSMEPVVSSPDAAYSILPENLPEVFGQYELLAAEMLKRGSEGAGFTFYHYKLDLKGGPCLYKRMAGCGVGTEYLAVTPEGELYPCHQFVGNTDFRMGDIRAGVTNSALRDSFRSRAMYSPAECRECWASIYCSGGCAANAYNATGSVGGVYGLGCEMFKKRIECAIMMKAAEAVSNNISTEG